MKAPPPLRPRRLLKAAARLLAEARLAAAAAPARLASLARAPGPHPLPGELVVSLTSWPPRFPFLHRTVLSLLRQSVRPDRIVLWIAEADFDRLPLRVRRLAAYGVELRRTADTGPYKKLVPALAAFPRSFIVTADDDVPYGRHWLRDLAAGFVAGDPAIVCHRAHRPHLREDGTIAPFGEWQRDVQDEPSRRSSAEIVPTGVGGILYPPGSLDARVLDSRLFASLCPTADDFWFFWMARLNGTLFRKVGGRFPYRDWPGSQTESLHPANLRGGYDRQLASLCARFGVPDGLRDCH